VNKQEIERIWNEFDIARLPDQDMTNECRLAAEVVRLRRCLEGMRAALREVHARSFGGDTNEALGHGPLTFQVGEATAQEFARAANEAETKLMHVGVTIEGSTPQLNEVEHETGCHFPIEGQFIEGVALVPRTSVPSLVKQLKEIKCVRIVTVEGVKA